MCHDWNGRIESGKGKEKAWSSKGEAKGGWHKQLLEKALPADVSAVQSKK